MEDLHLEVDDKGFTRIGKGKANARVATAVKGDDFLKWYRRAGRRRAKAALPKKPGNRSTLIARTGHAEPRPLLRGLRDRHREALVDERQGGDEERAAGGSKRACRGVLTQDFDDLQGDMKTMYTAVIFNPVPGPPMGKNPRLSFRYWLKGTDTLRVQIYSLTNGYHRYLSLTGLPQEKWQAGTVDMTAGAPARRQRRPAVRERAHRRHPVLRRSAGRAAHRRHRPVRRRRCRERSGRFRSASSSPAGSTPASRARSGRARSRSCRKKGYFWKAAKSVENPKLDAPWIRLHLRGERPLGETTQLFFRYRLEGADALKVVLVNRTQKTNHVVELKDLKKGDWAEATVDFNAAGKTGQAAQGRQGR